MAQKLLSKNLISVRKEKGLSQKSVSIKSGIIASTISRIETCEVSPNLSTITRLANALDVSVERLFKSDYQDNKTLMDKLKTIENLNDENRKTIELMIDFVIDKDNLEKK